MKALALFLSITCLAHAEESPDSIVVYGNKENRTYNETTESLSILNEDFLGGAGRENDIRVLNAIPNVSVNRGGDSFSIRGINNTGVTGFQKDNLASILIDDVFQTELATDAGSFDLWDMEHVEVFRGAQSSTQGVNSLAGNILLYHNQPRFENSGAAKLGIGSFQQRELGVVLNSHLLDQKWASRAYYNRETNDGFLRNATTLNDSWSARTKDAAGITLLRKFSDRDELTISGKYNSLQRGGEYVQGSEAFRDQVTEDRDFSQRTNNYQTSLRYVRKLNDGWTEDALATYSTSRQNVRSDADGLPQDLAGTRLETHEDDFTSFENLLKFQSERTKNVLGFHAHHFYLEDDYDFNLLYPVGTSATPIHVIQDVKRYRTALSLFDSWVYSLSDIHSINLGGRLEYVKNRYGTDVQATRVNNLGAGTNTVIDNYLGGVSGNYSGANENTVFLPKASYVVHLGAYDLGATYSRAYRTGGVAINRSRAKAVEYGPEFTDNYELSLKANTAGVRWQANAFYVNWSRQQVLVQLSKDFFDTQVTNASRSEVWGAEAQAEKELFENHALTIGGGFARTSFLDFVNNGVNYNGHEFPFASRFTGRITETWHAFPNFSFLTIVRLTGPSFTNAENTRRSPSQIYLDASAQYRYGSWAAELYANNILDRRYLVYDGTPSSASSFQGMYSRVNTPREIGGRISFMW